MGIIISWIPAIHAPGMTFNHPLEQYSSTWLLSLFRPRATCEDHWIHASPSFHATLTVSSSPGFRLNVGLENGTIVAKNERPTASRFILRGTSFAHFRRAIIPPTPAHVMSRRACCWLIWMRTETKPRNCDKVWRNQAEKTYMALLVGFCGVCASGAHHSSPETTWSKRFTLRRPD